MDDPHFSGAECDKLVPGMVGLCVCLCVTVLWVLGVRERPEVTDAEPPSEEVVGKVMTSVS